MNTKILIAALVFAHILIAIHAKILIIGAGASGIAAATRLYRNGYRDLEILEANNRIGGRLNTVSFGANVVDLGAQWCHGEENNAVYELAGPLGLLETSVMAGEEVLLRSNGEVLPEDIYNRLSAVASDIMESEELETYKGTLEKFVTERYWAAMANPAYQDISQELKEEYLRLMRDLQEGLIAIDSWSELSGAGSSADETCDGEQYLSWKEKGFKSVLELLMNKHVNQTGDPIPVENLVKLNKFVTKINWKNGSGQPVTVTCSDGTQYEASHVIVTTSLGVLKENLASMFNPRLPKFKENAIKGLYFGTVNKVIMEFSNPFWSDLGESFGLMWKSQDLEELQNSEYPWAEGVTLFYKVDNQPNLLTAWLQGPKGRQTELLDDNTVIDGIVFLLNKFFKNKTIERPINVIRSKWFSDRNFRGSYSSISLTTEALNTGNDDLAEPLEDSAGVPVLLFAGEATDEKYFGTVHGAIESGWREADRIIDYYTSKGGSNFSPPLHVFAMLTAPIALFLFHQISMVTQINL